MFTYVLLIIGFYFLIKGADLLVTGASALAKRFKVSDIVIGLVIVAFGTSLPELVVNVIGSLEGKTELVISNVMGSNIANILLILGVSAVIYPLSVQKDTLYKEIPFALLAVVAMMVMVSDVGLNGQVNNMLSRADGLMFLLFFMVFLYYIFLLATRNTEKEKEILEEVKTTEMPIIKVVGYIAIGLLGLVLGGQWIVEGAVLIASALGLSQSLIGLTVVAIGTSLPELATSAVAAMKKQTDIAIGNIVGSNIFNFLWILGLSATISPLAFAENSGFDLLVVLLATLLLFLMVFVGKRYVLEKWQGYAFIVMYVVYIAYVVFVDLGMV